MLHCSKHLNISLVPFNERWLDLITLTQRTRLALILSPSNEIHVSVNDTINDDILRFPFCKVGLSFHKTIDILTYITEGPEVVLPQAGRKVRCAAKQF